MPTSNPIEALIVDLLRERGPMIGRDIVAAMQGFNVHHVRSLLLEMALDQRLEIVTGPRLALPIDRVRYP